MTGSEEERVSVGVPGLDEVLQGGLLRNRTYLVRGAAGSGKTILGLHFLAAGAAAGESSLFITLEEPEHQVRGNADAVGIDLEDVNVLDLSPDPTFFTESRGYDIFAPDEVEGAPLSKEIAGEIDAHDPDRVVLDPVTQLRYLSADQYQFRTQVLSFIRFLKQAEATVLLTSQVAASTPDDDLQFMVDGVVSLDARADLQTVDVPKFRGSGTTRGTHAFRIESGGMRVFPDLVPAEHGQEFVAEAISSGVNGVDDLLHGGIERGTVTILSGPTGAGKTTLGTHFMKEAASRDERSVIYLFEESKTTFNTRSSAIGVPIEEMTERGTLAVEPVEPLAHSAQEFGQAVRREVEERDARVVMIDGVDGFRLALRGEDADLRRRLHAICRFLKNQGVTVILVDEVGSVTGDFQVTSGNLSYLADNIIFIRYLELAGEIRKAIGVLKKRTSTFEPTLRDFAITGEGLEVGEPLTGLRGVLRGNPDLRAGEE